MSSKALLKLPSCGSLATKINNFSFIKRPICLTRCLSGQTSPEPIARRLLPAQADKLTDIGIREIFNSDHDTFRNSIRKFLHQEVVPDISQAEERGYFDRELWQRAGELGMLGLTTPAEHGGGGAGATEAAIAWEEVHYSDPAGNFGGTLVHSEVVMPYISSYGSKEQRKRYIPGMTSGHIIGATAMTEPGAGSDLQAIKTRAVRDGDDWILNGSKTYITNGWLSDVCVVVARTKMDVKSPAHGTSLFLVDADMPGFTKGKPLKKLGLKGMDTCELFFDDVRLPSTALLGEENRGFLYLMNQLPLERLMISGYSLAIAEASFELAREFVKQRKAFGGTIADLQTVQHTLAELKTAICVARAFVDQCILTYDKGTLGSSSASMAKYWATELANRVAYDCLQLHGGAGFMWEYPICRGYAAVRVSSILGGTTQIMKELIARSIVKK